MFYHLLRFPPSHSIITLRATPPPAHMGEWNDIWTLPYVTTQDVTMEYVDWLSPQGRAEFCRQRRSQFIVAGGHNIPESHGSPFAAEGRHSYLWPNATRITKSEVLAKIETSKSYSTFKISFRYLRLWINLLHKKEEEILLARKLARILKDFTFVKIKYLWDLGYTYTFAKHLKTDQLVYYVFCVI